MSQEPPKKYSPLWISLHWAIALLLFVEFLLGLSTRFVTPDYWMPLVSWHMPLGILILLLLIIRIIVRNRTPHPEPATVGNMILDKIGVITHYLLYVLAVILPISGMLLSINYGISPIQSDFISNLRWVPSLHRLIAPAFGLLILLHIGAALYHQVIRKDQLLSRMWYGE